MLFVGRQESVDWTTLDTCAAANSAPLQEDPSTRYISDTVITWLHTIYNDTDILSTYTHISITLLVFVTTSLINTINIHNWYRGVDYPDLTFPFPNLCSLSTFAEITAWRTNLCASTDVNSVRRTPSSGLARDNVVSSSLLHPPHHSSYILLMVIMMSLNQQQLAFINGNQSFSKKTWS